MALRAMLTRLHAWLSKVLEPDPGHRCYGNDCPFCDEYPDYLNWQR